MTKATRLFSVMVVVLVAALSLFRAAPAPAAETTIGNNLSVPVIWAEGKTIVLRGVYGAPTWDGATATAADGTTTVWLQQDAGNTWQAQTVDGSTAPVNVSWVDWGDNLEGKALSTSGQIRVETKLLQDLTNTTMTGFTTLLVSGSGTDEMWGATQATYAGTQAVVYTNNARLTIQKLTADPAGTTLTWDPTTGTWKGNIVDTASTPINVTVWDGTYAAEVSVSGGMSYGYNWRPGVAGYYRLTYSLDDGTKSGTKLNTFLTNAQILTSTETATASVLPLAGSGNGGGGDTGGGTAAVDPTNNLTYIDVVVGTPTSATDTPTPTTTSTPGPTATATPGPGSGNRAYFPTVGQKWQSPMVIQNMDTVDATSLSVEFISTSTGQVVKTVDLGRLAAGKSVAVRPYQMTDLPSGDYSAVATSDAKISGIVNESSGKMAGSYHVLPSIQLTGSSVNFPNVVRNYAGWNSPLYVQNASSSATTVTLKFYRFDNGALAATTQASLNGGQTYEIDPATVSGLTDGTQYSAVATSSAGLPLVGVTNQMRSGSAVMTYNALPSGGSVVSLPNITRNYYNWNTPFIVQNVGTAKTDVTVTYYKFSDGSLAKTDGPYTIGAGLSQAFRPHQTNGLADNTQYSVVVQSSSQPIVAVVNEDNGTAAMSYAGSTSGGTSVDLPNVTRNYYGWNTPFVVQNVGTANTNVTVSYYRMSDGSLAKTDGPYTIGAGLSQAFRPHQTNGLADNTQYSVVVQSSSQPITAIVNEENPSSDAMSYEGINH